MASLLLNFSATTPAATSVGPYSEYRLEGETIRAVPGGEVLAEHKSHAWMVKGERYLRLDCSAPVYVQLFAKQGSSSARLGPFGHLSFVDGVCYADREVFAVADRVSHDWYHLGTERHWAAMVLTPVVG